MVRTGTWEKLGGGLVGVVALALALAGCGGETKTPAKPDGGGSGGRANGTGGTGSGGSGAGGSSGTGGSFVPPGTGGAGGAGGGQGGSSVDGPVEDAAPDMPVDTRPALPTAAVPAPWKGEDIGMPGMPGGSGRTQRNYQLKASGTDIWAEQDHFHFLHREVTGDVEIVARVASMERLNPDVKAGVMFRETLAADARNAFMLVMPGMANAMGVVSGKGTRLQFRDKRTDNLTGFYDVTMTNPPNIDTPPVWLRLTRTGNRFEGWISGDGTTWKSDGLVEIAMPPKVAVGLALTGHTNNDSALAVFEGVRVTALTDAEFRHAELGTVGGFAAGSPRSFDLVSAGRGLANDEDGITFVHHNEQHLGDVEITTRVAALSTAGTSAAKAGIMLRGMLRGDARMLSFFVELSQGGGQKYRMQRRAQDMGDISSTNEMVPPAADGGAPDTAPEAAPVADAGADGGAPPVPFQPVWIKLIRYGNRFVGLVSPTGRRGTWRAAIDLPSFVIPANAFVGVALTSSNQGESVAGRFESLTISDDVDTDLLPERPDAAADSAAEAGTGDAAGN